MHTLLIMTYFYIMARVIVYVTPIICMTLSYIHLIVKMSGHSSTTPEFQMINSYGNRQNDMPYIDL